MENNKSEFKATGIYFDGARVYEIQIARSGDAARYRMTVKEYGNRDANHSLWAHDEQKQIDKMRELYDLLPIKPEWLTREQIDEYAAQMGAK